MLNWKALVVGLMTILLALPATAQELLTPDEVEEQINAPAHPLKCPGDCKDTSANEQADKAKAVLVAPQASEPAECKQLWATGSKLYDLGRFQEAADKFEEGYSNDKCGQDGFLFNLATALIRTGTCDNEVLNRIRGMLTRFGERNPRKAHLAAIRQAELTRRLAVCNPKRENPPLPPEPPTPPPPPPQSNNGSGLADGVAVAAAANAMQSASDANEAARLAIAAAKRKIHVNLFAAPSLNYTNVFVGSLGLGLEIPFQDTWWLVGNVGGGWSSGNRLGWQGLLAFEREVNQYLRAGIGVVTTGENGLYSPTHSATVGLAPVIDITRPSTPRLLLRFIPWAGLGVTPGTHLEFTGGLVGQIGMRF